MFLVDNRRRALNPARQTVPLDLSLFIENSKDIRRLKISPQILLAAHRFLLAEVEPFRSLSSKILLTLLKRDVVVLINYNLLEPDDEKLYIYHKNVPTDYFVLILEVSSYQCVEKVIINNNCLTTTIIKTTKKWRRSDDILPIFQEAILQYCRLVEDNGMIFFCFKISS